MQAIIFGRPLRVTVHAMLWDRCLSCLSVTLVYCGQTVGWIKIPLGMEVGLGPRHCVTVVLDGDPAPLPWKGAQQPQLFSPCLLWPNGCPSQQLLSTCQVIICSINHCHETFRQTDTSLAASFREKPWYAGNKRLNQSGF